MAIPCKTVEVEEESLIVATDITAPATVKLGENILGQATFTNIGGTLGSQLCQVTFDGDVVAEVTLTLEPNTIGYVYYSNPAEELGYITICPHPNP